MDLVGFSVVTNSSARSMRNWRPGSRNTASALALSAGMPLAPAIRTPLSKNVRIIKCRLPRATPLSHFAFNFLAGQQLFPGFFDEFAYPGQLSSNLGHGRPGLAPIALDTRVVGCSRHDSIVTPIQHTLRQHSLKIIESTQSEIQAAKELLNVEKSSAIRHFKLNAAGVGV